MTHTRWSESAEVRPSLFGERLSRYFSAPPTILSSASLISSTGWSIAIGISASAFALLASMLIARVLGPSKMGDYSYWMWLVGTVALLMDLGIAGATLKFSAELLGHSDNVAAATLVAILLRVQVAAGAIVAAGLLFYGLLFGPVGEKLLYVAIAGIVLVGGPAAVAEGAIKGALDYRFSAHVAVVSGAFQVVLVAAILYYGGGVRALLLVFLATGTLFLFVRIHRMRRLYPRQAFELSAEFSRAVFRYCRSKVGLSLLDAIVWARSEVFFLALFSAREQIAFYSLAYGTASQLIVGATLIAHPLVPTFSMLSARKDVVRTAQLYRAAIRYVAFMSFPVAIGGIVVATPLLTLLYGDAYSRAAPVLMITAASSLAVALMYVCSSVLYGLGRPDYLVRINLVLAAVNLLASLVLIPTYGAVGAAAANAIGPVLSLVAGARLLQRRYGLEFPAYDVAKVFAAASIAAVFSHWLTAPSGWPSLLAGCTTGAVAYIVAVTALRVFGPDDQERFQGIANRLPWGLRGVCLRMVSVLAVPSGV